MSTLVQVLTMLKDLQQNQWLTVDPKTKVVKVATKGWFSSHGKDGEIIERTVNAALEALDKKDADIAAVMPGVEAALDRRQARALNLEFREEHTLFYGLKTRVHEAMQGVIILKGQPDAEKPLLRKTSKPKTIIAAARLCFSPRGQINQSLMNELMQRVARQEAHTPSVPIPRALPTITPPPPKFEGSPPPSKQMLLDALKRMGINRNDDDNTPFEDECSRLGAVEV
ncbi:MAG: hypothetical protein KDK62_06240 [Chlamydiia bacterium]|nr:hypothetical protein [Chlamydiia bacterium]